MATTTNGLYVFEDGSTGEAYEMLKKLFAQGDGSESKPYSNMQIIDTLLSEKAKNPATETFSVAASEWNDLSDGSPFTKQAAITATAAIGADTLVELINDNAIAFGTYGFAIGGVTGQVITVYALSAPSASVTLKIEIGG